ncbi:hypothetical protein [uncultured Amnibacterium sp.]|uniref:hypothetical protein n=1 Tax=uncultured Amnibacterium sp. TaxID=1631851 RepID=UPI0035CC016E
MSQRNTVIRSMHDLGMAAWFGGTLMGAVGLNGAAAKAIDPTERLRLSSIGWGRWAPVQGAAILTHAIGGVGVIITNRGRLAAQSDARVNSYIKLPLTIVAAGLSLYSGILGTRIAKHADEGATGVTEPGAGTSDELAAVQRQQKIVQWTLPLITGVLIVLGAQQGEQQRPVAGWLDRFKR